MPPSEEDDCTEDDMREMGNKKLIHLLISPLSTFEILHASCNDITVGDNTDESLHWNRELGEVQGVLLGSLGVAVIMG